MFVRPQDSLPWSPTVRMAIGDLPRLPDPSRSDDLDLHGSETMSFDEGRQGGAAGQPLSRYAQWCRTAELPRGGGRRQFRQVLYAHHRSKNRVPLGGRAGARPGDCE